MRDDGLGDTKHAVFDIGSSMPAFFLLAFGRDSVMDFLFERVLK